MTSVTPAAEALLVATCAHIALSDGRNENSQMWLEVLRDALPDCHSCPLAMANLRTSARILTQAQSPVDRDNALARLKIEVREYYAVAAGYRFEVWQAAQKNSVVEDVA